MKSGCIVLNVKSMLFHQMSMRVIFLSLAHNAKPVSQWNMKFPNAVANLANRYERGQVSLCGLFMNVL